MKLRSVSALGVACVLVATPAAAQRRGGPPPPPGTRVELKTPSGKPLKSAETVQKYNLDWTLKNLASPPTDKPNVKDDPLRALLDQSWLPAEARYLRPTMVWFCNQEPDAELNKRLFGTDEAALAARYFDCFKIFVEDIESKEDLRRYAKTLPAIYFFDAGAKETGRLIGSGEAPAVYREMAKAANVWFKKPLTPLVLKYGEFLKTFDEFAEGAGKLKLSLEQHELLEATSPSDKLAATIKMERAQLEASQKEREKLVAEEKAILNAELKGDPYAPAPDDKKPAK
jgi:hypothetical protein